MWNYDYKEIDIRQLLDDTFIEDVPLVDNIESMIEKGKINKAFEFAKTLILEDSDLASESKLLKARFFMLERQNNQRVITRDEYNNELAKITNSFLQLLNEIKKAIKQKKNNKIK